MNQLPSLFEDTVPTPEKRQEFGADGGISAAGGWSGIYEGGSFLGQNTLGVTGVPQFTYSTNIIGDPWPIKSTVINEYTVLSLPSMWRALRFLSESLAGLPADVCQCVGSARKKLDNHPLNWTLNQEINGLQTPFDTKAVLYHHALIWGNGYLAIARNPDGSVKALYNMMPDRVIPFRFLSDTGDVVQYYAVGGVAAAGGLHVLPASEVVHIAGLGFDGLRGYPVVQLLAASLRIGKAAESFGDRYFANGGHLGGTIESPTKLTPEQVESLRVQVASGYTGVSNSHRWMVLQGGATAKPMTLPPDSAQYLSTREFAVVDVSRILGVPPHILFDLSRATWNNVLQLETEVVKYTLQPWVIKSEQELSRKLLSTVDRKANKYVRLNLEALQRGDPVQQIESASKRLACGLTTRNEERAELGREPDANGGDNFYVPAQWMRADGTPNTTPVAQTPPAATETAIVPHVAPQVPSVASHNSVTSSKVAEPVKSGRVVDVSHFSALVEDAANRVTTKTDKATPKAQEKFATDRDGWTRWSNVFANEQAGYVVEAVGPILSTISTITGHQFDANAASGIGETYAGALRGHFAQLARNEATVAPDIAHIITTSINRGIENAETEI